MYILKPTIIASVLILSVFGAKANAPVDRHTWSAVSLQLSVTSPVITGKRNPQFSVRITNSSERSVKILDIEGRPDFQNEYCEIVVEQSGALVEILSAISDPGSLQHSAYVELHPGEQWEFILPNSPHALYLLPAGTYEAFLRLVSTPLESAHAIVSNRVKLEVPKNGL